MFRCISVVTVLAAVAVAGGEPEKQADLDVSRVAVFSSGVAFFECDGTVVGDSAVELKFRTDQINDILKSLVVQDFDGGTVSVVSYGSQDPVERTLRSFAVDITGNPSFGELLDQLRGEAISIAGPRKLEGVIVGVEELRQREDDTIIEEHMLTVLTPDGMQSLPIHELQGVRLTNEKIDGELRAALATLAAGRDADKKTVSIRFDGQGERRVRVMYLLEAPIWKTSYRLVLSGEGKPLLQGWATVENATEEDWDDVRLALVSGRPISFRMDMYTPLYVPRPLEELELYASLRPPSYEGAEWEESREMVADKMPAAPARMMRGVAKAGEAPASAGVTMQRLNTLGYAGDAVGFVAGGAGVTSVAEAAEAGELFQYVLSQPVSIGRQHSAMLPIVTQEVDADKVSIFNPATHPKHPLNGLRLKNTSGLSLMQGPITVFDGGTYAGDAKLPDMQADDERLLAYALDLPVEVISKPEYNENEVSLRIAKGVLYRQLKATQQTEYTVQNGDTDKRTVLIEVVQNDGWDLVEPKEPTEKTANMLRFAVDVAGKKSAKQMVRLEHIREEGVRLGNTGLDQIELYLRSRVISDKVKQALQRVVELRTELDRLAEQRGEAERNGQAAADDQERVRQNLKTLDKNTDQYTRQLQKFDEDEALIDQWRNKAIELRAAEQKKSQELETYLLSLTVE
ncbi:MAG: hypothetical protein JXO22_04270 [Phycisphaerae bacterium]|nr:hypothetical protein [Phycisphaerae bacterium]